MEKSNSFGPYRVTRTQVLQDFVKAVKIAGFEGIVLKGGVNLESALRSKNIHSFRTTVDIDLHVESVQIWQDFVARIETDVSGNSPLKVKYEVEGTKMKEIEQYDRARILANGHIGFTIDMNLSRGKIEVSVFDPTYFEGYSIGTMLADKIKVFLSPKIYRRSKDIYDLFLISKMDDFEMSEIRPAVKQKWEFSGAPELPLHEADLDKLQHAYDKLKDLDDQTPFEEVYDRVLSFATGIWATIEKGYVDTHWNSSRGDWE